MNPGASERTAVVFGARHLGRGLAARLSGSGWRVVAAARTEATIDSLTSEHPDVIGRALDLGAPGAAAEVLEQGRATAREPSTSSSTRSPTRKSRPRASGSRGGPPPRVGDGSVMPVHNVVDATVRLLRAQGRGCFIQITGGLALRALAGTGPLAATGYVTRALIEGAVPEAREDGVHVALLVIRGMIESDLTATSLEGKPQRASMTDDDVHAAIEFLYSQGAGRAWTHELVLTPPAAPWQG